MKEPKLAPPGAGLPLAQRLVARWYLGPIVSARSSWKDSRPLFERYYSDISTLAQGLREEEMARRVLVPPIQGLEDSSRFWSPAMVLEHLVIVGKGVEHIIIELSHGRDPGIEVDLAKIKPGGKETIPDARRRFEEFRLSAPSRIESAIGDWASKSRHVHPWFGPFNARQWAWILAMHGSVHRRQIREIVKARV